MSWRFSTDIILRVGEVQNKRNILSKVGERYGAGPNTLNPPPEPYHPNRSDHLCPAAILGARPGTRSLRRHRRRSVSEYGRPCPTRGTVGIHALLDRRAPQHARNRQGG